MNRNYLILLCLIAQTTVAMEAEGSMLSRALSWVRTSIQADINKRLKRYEFVNSPEDGEVDDLLFGGSAPQEIDIEAVLDERWEAVCQEMQRAGLPVKKQRCRGHRAVIVYTGKRKKCIKETYFITRGDESVYGAVPVD